MTVRRARRAAGLQRMFEARAETKFDGGGGGDGGGQVAAGASDPAPGVASALRQSREALVDIQGQLDALLAALRTPDAAPDSAAPERLRNATRRAGSALAALGATAGIR